MNAWDKGWDEKLHTVPPWNVNRLTLQYLKLLKIKHKLGLCSTKPKIVIHYIQPHSPYIAGPIDFSKIYYFYLGKLKRKITVSEHAVLIHLMEVLDDIKKVNYVLRKAYEENLKLFIIC